MDNFPSNKSSNKYRPGMTTLKRRHGLLLQDFGLLKDQRREVYELISNFILENSRNHCVSSEKSYTDTSSTTSSHSGTIRSHNTKPIRKDYRRKINNIRRPISLVQLSSTESIDTVDTVPPPPPEQPEPQPTTHLHDESKITTSNISYEEEVIVKSEAIEGINYLASDTTGYEPETRELTTKFENQMVFEDGRYQLRSELEKITTPIVCISEQENDIHEECTTKIPLEAEISTPQVDEVEYISEEEREEIASKFIVSYLDHVNNAQRKEIFRISTVDDEYNEIGREKPPLGGKVKSDNIMLRFIKSNGTLYHYDGTINQPFLLLTNDLKIKPFDCMHNSSGDEIITLCEQYYYMRKIIKKLTSTYRPPKRFGKE